MQLDIFEEANEVALLRKELKEVRERAENARKGLFARHNELIKLYMSLKEEIEHVKAINYKPSKVELVPFFNGYLENYKQM